MNFNKFVEWKRALLERTGIPVPDGRPLYLYRISADEFKGLEELLRYWLEQLLPRYGLAQVANLASFSELFVLYAAEWWRRRYDGSGFTWEPILRDLGANPDEWSATQRSEFVKQGFRGWRIKPRESGGLRFIGSVAVQGGLPLKLLASSHGRIGHLLSRVLQLASGSQVTQGDLLTWVESLGNTLPQTYRQATIYTLLAEVAWTVLNLKQAANLKSSADAVSRLDRAVPAWRDRFPLPVDDVHAQGMIEQLIRDAASVRVEKQRAVLPVNRILEQVSDREWELRSSLILPDVLSEKQLAQLFAVEEESLPRSADLSLMIESSRLSTSLRKLAGQDKYRLERRPWGFSNQLAMDEHILSMQSTDGRVWSVTASRGDGLDPDLPWVFVERDSIISLVRQGSGSVAAQQALIALPTSWAIEQETEITDELGAIAGIGRRVLRVKGSVRAHNDEGLSFRLRTGRADAVEESYSWSGERYWLDFLSPNAAFKGLPALYRVSQDGARSRLEGQIGTTVVGGSEHSRALTGPLYLRYPATGDVQYRSRVLVLPKSAYVELKPQDATSGAIWFYNWGIARVLVTTEGIQQSFEMADGDAVLELSIQDRERVPDMIELEAWWPHSATPAIFRLPFPVKGVRVFSGDGRSLANNSLLAVQQLHGVRILISGGQVNSHAEMTILDASGRHVRRYPLRTLPGALSMEVRLQDFLSDIQQQLSTSDEPDARVKVEISLQGATSFTLSLARYAAVMERDGDVIRLDSAGLRLLSPDELVQLPVMAIRLESPGDEVSPLEPFTSEGVSTGGWLFGDTQRIPGSWLVYPAAESPLPFRPTLWFVEGETNEAEGLSSVLTIVDRQLRDERIAELIEELAMNFCHEDWEKVEQLAGQIGHLPLPTLDLWRHFARSPRGMAALALRFGSLKPDFITRFAQELPFAWEAIAFADWRSAISELDVQCKNVFGEQSGPVVLAPHLSSRIQLLTSMNGALAFILGIAAKEWLPDTQRDVDLLKYLGLQANHILFEGESSKLMKLRRMHAEDDWPEDLKSLWSSIQLDPRVAPCLHTHNEGYRTWVINIPIILAAQAATTQTIDWFQYADRIHALRNYQAFDPDWFDEAYNQTVAHCFADGLLGEETE